MDAAIEAAGLTKSYGSARGIIDVDLRVEVGEVFGFLGPNGAGKTTLIRTLLDLLRPTSGQVRVLGLDAQTDSLEIRRRTAYLPGDLELYERMTAATQLDWLADLSGGVAPGRIEELAGRVNLDLSRPIKELSKGNRQKVGIVQAFMVDAELLILDEPTSGLDPLMQREFATMVHETAEAGRTVFLSSHRLDETQEIADRVGIIRDGRMIKVSKVADLRAEAVRHVTVRFGSDPDLTGWDGVPGFAITERDDALVRLRVDGAMSELIDRLAGMDVVDLISESADLDEIFLGYYEAPDDQRGSDLDDGPAN